jgi:protein disulfide-isomerase
MRFLSLSVLSALFASAVLAQTGEQSLNAGSPDLPEEVSTEEASDEPVSTVFNGLEVPPLLEINGTQFDATVAEGYWFVKHYS